MTVYPLDANVFIQVRNPQYGLDVCPGLRDWLIEQNSTGGVASIAKVADELQGVDGQFAERAALNVFGNNPPVAIVRGAQPDRECERCGLPEH